MRLMDSVHLLAGSYGKANAVMPVCHCAAKHKNKGVTTGAVCRTVAAEIKWLRRTSAMLQICWWTRSSLQTRSC